MVALLVGLDDEMLTRNRRKAKEAHGTSSPEASTRRRSLEELHAEFMQGKAAFFAWQDKGGRISELPLRPQVAALADELATALADNRDTSKVAPLPDATRNRLMLLFQPLDLIMEAIAIFESDDTFAADEAYSGMVELLEGVASELPRYGCSDEAILQFANIVAAYAREQYNIAMPDITSSIRRLAHELAIPRKDFPAFRRHVLQFREAGEVYFAQAINRVISLTREQSRALDDEGRIARAAELAKAEASKPHAADAAPAWPTEKWESSPEKAFHKRHAIVEFLRRVWKPEIEKNGAPITREFLKQVDEGAAEAVKGYVKYRKLPDDLPIFTLDEITDYLVKRAPSRGNGQRRVSGMSDEL